MRFYSACMALVLMASSVHAEIRNPADLAHACETNRTEVDGYVAGWIDKLLDDQFVSLQITQQQTDPKVKIQTMEIFFNVSMNVCLPEVISIREASDHVCQRALAKHDFRGDRASGFISYVLSEKHPCQTR